MEYLVCCLHSWYIFTVSNAPAPKDQSGPWAEEILRPIGDLSPAASKTSFTLDFSMWPNLCLIHKLSNWVFIFFGPSPVPLLPCIWSFLVLPTKMLIPNFPKNWHSSPVEMSYVIWHWVFLMLTASLIIIFHIAFCCDLQRVLLLLRWVYLISRILDIPFPIYSYSV